MSESLIAIVPAAGIGARPACPARRPFRNNIARWPGSPCCATRCAPCWPIRASSRCVAVSAGDGWVEQALAGLPRTVWRPCGGPNRADTVAAALADSGAAADDWILVHDAARPGLPAAALARLIDACLDDAVGGLLALPVADTVKAGRQRVSRTVDRDGLWLAQTPQMFRAGLLRDALARARAAGLAVTDEASAVEAAGHAPRLVAGALRNFKVTWPDDFELMEKWL
ncbi:2-C-methyl-D-erythritol 4-phosphate cytidylyltransferase [Bordetella pertussis]|uniref:2-C-methyl-D-erythritol 4-phosphate cytidylyltransferase n=1 Tax=Bordetella pertussis TaxID=520 RepID=UPI003EBC2530